MEPTAKKKRIGRPSEGLESVLYVRVTTSMRRTLVALRRAHLCTEAAIVRMLLADAIARHPPIRRIVR